MKSTKWRRKRGREGAEKKYKQCELLFIEHSGHFDDELRPKREKRKKRRRRRKGKTNKNNKQNKTKLKGTVKWALKWRESVRWCQEMSEIKDEKQESKSESLRNWCWKKEEEKEGEEGV